MNYDQSEYNGIEIANEDFSNQILSGKYFIIPILKELHSIMPVEIILR
jgi:hypothetical protein